MKIYRIYFISSANFEFYYSDLESLGMIVKFEFIAESNIISNTSGNKMAKFAISLGCRGMFYGAKFNQIGNKEKLRCLILITISKHRQINQNYVA